MVFAPRRRGSHAGWRSRSMRMRAPRSWRPTRTGSPASATRSTSSRSGSPPTRRTTSRITSRRGARACCARSIATVTAWCMRCARPCAARDTRSRRASTAAARRRPQPRGRRSSHSMTSSRGRAGCSSRPITRRVVLAAGPRRCRTRSTRCCRRSSWSTKECAAGAAAGSSCVRILPCSRPRSARRTASSTSSRTRPRTSSTRSASSAGSTARASEHRRATRCRAGRRGRAVHLQDRATDAGVPARSCRARRSAAIKNFYETAVEPAADPGHRAAVHRREAASSTPVEPFDERRQPRGAAAASTSSSTASTGSPRCTSTCSEHPDDAKHDPRPVRDLRRQERRLRDRDVRDHQLDADAHQQEPPGRPLREGVVGRARQEVRGAHRRAALQRGRQPAALPDQPPRRPQQAGEVDPAGRAVQRAPPLGRARLEADRSRAELRSARPSATTRSSATSSRRREKVWGDAWGNAELHGHHAR